MAGSIIIADNQQLPVSSIQFDYLAHRIRASFQLGEDSCRDEVFFPHDIGGMPFISTKSLDPLGFRIFSLAVERAHSKALKEDLYSTFTNLWERLLEIVRADSRLDATQ